MKIHYKFCPSQPKPWLMMELSFAHNHDRKTGFELPSVTQSYWQMWQRLGRLGQQKAKLRFVPCKNALSAAGSESRSVMSDPLRPHGLYSPWNPPGQNTGVDSLCLLQGIFPTQGSNPRVLLCRRILYQLSHRGDDLSIWTQISPPSYCSLCFGPIRI